MRKHLPFIKILIKEKLLFIFLGFLLGLAFIASIVLAGGKFQQLRKSHSKVTANFTKISTDLEKTQKDLEVLKSQDQYKINQDLKKKIESIEKTYKSAVSVFERISDLKARKVNTTELEKELVKSLKMLADKDYSSSEESLKKLSVSIDTEFAKLAPTASPVDKNLAASATSKNSAPSSGYSRQLVKSDIGDFVVDIVAADLNSTRVIVDTASESDCRDNCPVLSLGDYVGRNGAFAGINGSYFCPASYPTCAGKTNSYDTLLMNKNKKYFNSDNNVYSNVPAVIFGGNWARFVGSSSQWGRDTGVDAVLANQPLLVSGGNVVFGGDGEVKRTGKGSRSFVGSSGNIAYIGVVHNASTAEMARVLKFMGIQSALNLDSGGSTALWSGGYKIGPGRNIPNALLFVRK